MREINKKAVLQSIRAARENGSGSYASRYRTPEEIARLAHNTSVIEGRDLSREGLIRAAREIIGDTEGKTSH